MLTKLGLLLLLVLAAVAQTDNVSGRWTYTTDTPNGAVPVTLDLKAEGAKVTGTVHAGPGREFPIEQGSVEGNLIKFTVKRNRPQGGTISYEMNGTIDGATMKGTTTAEVNGEKVVQNWQAKKES